MIPIDEQIKYVTEGAAWFCRNDLLASLRRIKAIDDMRGELPDEPQHIIFKGNDCVVIALKDYDTLRDLLKRIVMEEIK
jgi:hypothetical protein